MDAAKRLKELRQINNLTTTELATKCGIHQSTISKLENNKRTIDLPTLEILCDALGTTLPDFFYHQPLPIHIYELLIECKHLTPKHTKSIIEFLRAFDSQGV